MNVVSERIGRSLRVAINRPDFRNAVDGATAAELADAFREFERDDELELDGYVKLEAWPTPEQAARVRVTFDPEAIDELGLKDAIVQPYWDAGLHDWRHAPFVIEGYDPLGGP